MKPKENNRLKRIERKIPNLITGDTFSSEYDINAYRFYKFKRDAPQLYLPYREQLIRVLDGLKLAMDDWHSRTRRKR